MGFSRSHPLSAPVENPTMLYFLVCLSTIYSARKADGPGPHFSKGVPKLIHFIH